MAQHQNIPSMLQESLPEMLLVAKYCIEFQKDTKNWSTPGCYGYPAALLLLSIADSIGSYVQQGNIKDHFKILNNPTYYGLTLNPSELEIIYDYRNNLSHNTVMRINIGLDIGTEYDLVLERKMGLYILNLIPFYITSVKAVKAFLDNPAVLENNRTIENIMKRV